MITTAHAAEAKGRKILVRAAMRHGISVASLVGPSQEPHLVPARREVSVQMRRLGWSLPRIGVFGALWDFIQEKRNRNKWWNRLATWRE